MKRTVSGGLFFYLAARVPGINDAGDPDDEGTRDTDGIGWR
jgi:hypothetical protein